MSNSQPDKSQLLTGLSPYIFGTTRLGDDKLPFDDRLNVASAAMEAGAWFHTSHHYGNALQVLRSAFEQDRTRVPKLIVKIGWNSIEEMRQIIQQHLDELNIETLELEQLCLSGSLAEEYAAGGNCYKEFERLKQEGLISRFVLEIFPWTSDVALRGLRGGYPEGIVDGYIFYLNPLQRFASNELWDELVARGEPMIAMRTVAGGNVYKLRDLPGYAWKPYLQERAAEVTPIFERSGIPSWTEFCIRFAHSFPWVRATVGATSRPENLREFLTAAGNITPISAELREEIVRLHYRWSDELDMHVEHWTM